MNPRRFTSLIGQVHVDWLGQAFHLSIPRHSGIDLTDEQVGLEVKSRYGKYSKRWAVHHYQYKLFQDENPDKELFWAFVLYNLSREPSEIQHNRVKMYIQNLQAWVIPWKSITEFPVSKVKTGPYYYPSSNIFKQMNLQPFQTPKGIIYFPRGSVLERRL